MSRATKGRSCIRPTEPRGPHAAGVSRIALRVKHLAELVRDLEAGGIAFESPPQEIDIVGATGFALLRDPDGVLIELIELGGGG